MRRYRRALGATLVAIAVAITSASIYRSPGASQPFIPGTANIWVDTNGGTCVDNATRVAYVDAQACSSFDAASDTAENGDLILIKNGSYGNQTITGSNSRTAMATLRAEDETTDNAVQFGILTVNGDWLTVQHLDSHMGETQHMGVGGCNLCVQQGGSNLVFDDVNLWGAWSAGEISGGSVHPIATNVTHQNSHIGSPGNNTDRLCAQDDEPFRVSEGNNISFIGNIYHPQWARTGCDFHLETFRLWDTIDLITFRNNIFEGPRGDNTGIISSDRGGCPPSTCPNNINHKIIQNFFGDKPGLAGFDFSTGEACEGVVFAYNTYYGPNGGFQNGCDTEGSGMIVVGNIGHNTGGCIVGGTNPINRSNLWYANSHGTCAGNSWLTGAQDDLSAYLFAADGWHLTASSPARNAAADALCQQLTLGVDIDGQPRDDGSCDAGADEYHP